MGLLVGSIVVICLLLGFGIWGLVRPERHFDTDRVQGGLCTILGAIAALVLLGCSIGTPIANYGKVLRMEAFYSANSINYQVAVDKTASYLSVDEYVNTILIEGSIEKFEYANQVALRVQEWRDAVNEYNKEFLEFKRWDKNFWLGIYYPTPPDELKLLVIE